MARPAAAALARPAASDLGGAGVAVVVLLALGVLVAWPLAVVLETAAGVPPPALAVVLDTLAVALGATAGALGLAAVLAVGVRAGIPGGEAVVQVCRLGVRMPCFVAPLALLALGVRRGLPAMALAQALALAPRAFALLVRALAEAPVEARQAAELLGASRWTVLRRVTLGLAGRHLVDAALVVLAACLADVAAPLLLAADRPVLAGAVVTAALTGQPAAAGSALVLAVLAGVAAVGGRAWRHALVPLALVTVPPAVRSPSVAAPRLWAALAWSVAGALVALWAAVPLAALLGARGVPSAGAPVLAPEASALLHSAALGFAVAILAPALALAAAWSVDRRRGTAGRVLSVLAGVPAAVPGVVAGLGCLLAFGAPSGDLALVAGLVAAWQLPRTLRVARGVLAHADRAGEQTALTLGAGRLTIVRRVMLPALAPAAAWIFVHGFAGGVLAVSTVVVLAGPELGAVHVLSSAAAGSIGAACVAATLLLAVAGGAALLLRAAGPRESMPSLLA